MRITGCVRDWETWTGLALPESGAYVFSRGLAPVTVDRAADVGSYWQPNVWMIHPRAVLTRNTVQLRVPAKHPRHLGGLCFSTNPCLH
jgi:hypothetical protein